MFNKTTAPGVSPRPAGDFPPPRPMAAPSIDAPSPTPPPPARSGRAAPSVIGPDIVFEGSIAGDGELLVEGTVKGDIHVARLVIGENAHVEGVARGGFIEVRGRIHGDIEGKKIHLLQTAHVEGDITHEQLAIEVGAFFQGRCQQFRPPPQPAVVAQAPQPVPAEAPEPVDIDSAASG